MQCTDAVVAVPSGPAELHHAGCFFGFCATGRISTKEAKLNELSPFIYFVQQNTSLSDEFQTFAAPVNVRRCVC